MNKQEFLAMSLSGELKRIVINEEETDYFCSICGEVFSLKRRRIRELKYNTHKDGYQMCYLFINGAKHSILRHRIVAKLFVSNPKNNSQVNHIDGIKSNCKANNLQWVTQSENIKHAYDNGLMKKNPLDLYNASLSEIEVLKIRKLILLGIKQREIASQFKVAEQLISRIKHNKGYVGVGLISKGEAIDVNTLEFNPYE